MGITIPGGKKDEKSSLDPKTNDIVPTASAANTMGVLSKLARSYTEVVVRRKMMEDLLRKKIGTFRMECQILKRACVCIWYCMDSMRHYH